LCAEEHIPFVLGHALYMKAIHGGKAKHDQIDSQKIVVLRLTTRWHAAAGRRLSRPEARHARPAVTPYASGTQTRRTPGACAQHQQPV
jgi:hypothetical protein